jgi:hypothetical protein
MDRYCDDYSIVALEKCSGLGWVELTALIGQAPRRVSSALTRTAKRALAQSPDGRRQPVAVRALGTQSASQDGCAASVVHKWTLEPYQISFLQAFAVHATLDKAQEQLIDLRVKLGNPAGQAHGHCRPAQPINRIRYSFSYNSLTEANRCHHSDTPVHAHIRLTTRHGF